MVRDGSLQIAGVDEVGRGCLFGPVVAAAVILSPTTAEVLLNAGVKDHKDSCDRLSDWNGFGSGNRSH
jgi:ribonuclease HII